MPYVCHSLEAIEMKKKIVIVEDDLIIQELHKHYVEDLGHEVIACCTSGEEAIEFFRDHHADLILMDVRLEDSLDGIDTVKKILSKMNPAVIFDLEKYHTGAFNKYNDHKNKFLFDVIVNNLNRGKQEGLYRKDININLIARFRLASMFLIFNPEIFPGEHFNLPQLIAETTDNFLYGIASEEGRLMIEHYKQLSKNLIPA